jgi:hypothetical protein
LRGFARSGEKIEDKAGGKRIILLICIALVALLLAAGFGWYQFRRRAEAPTGIVKSHAIHGTDLTIGEGILGVIKDRGIEVLGEGLKPSWGAEEIASNVWIVSYVFEAGRRARWISWKVYYDTGRVVPLDGLAGELWEGR